MKKRLLAIICTLVILLGVAAAAVPSAKAADTSAKYKVGWARVDLNPWTNSSKTSLFSLPMQGNANPKTRQSASYLMDDNGDGQINANDGLFATCLAVTDANEQTVLMYSVSIIGGVDTMVNDVREQVSAKLGIPAENIMIQGTHTHNSVDLNQYKSSYKDNTNTFYIQDQNGNLTSTTMTYAQMYENLDRYYNDILIPQLVAAAQTAWADRTAAYMSKGQISANDTATSIAGATRRMNGVRHYLRSSTKTGETYVHGANFNESLDYTSQGDYTLASANDTMYCLRFNFPNSTKKAIALVNWRAHATQNDRAGSYLTLSSDYINRMSYELEKSNYRSVFIQGAAGNINPVNAIYNNWCGSSYHNIKMSGGKITTASTLCGNIYGELLGKVAVECLKDSNMTRVDTGSIKVTQLDYYAQRKSYGDDISYYAGLAEYYARKAGLTLSYPFVYPLDVTSDVYKAMNTDQYSQRSKTFYDSLTGQTTYKDLTTSNYKGETYAVASQYHGDDIWANHNKTGQMKVDLTAFMLGENVAFVTAPGELYDRYVSLSWSDLNTATNSREKVNSIIANTPNDWDKLLGSNTGGSYGTPFVMGYANDNIGYFPTRLAYEYNQGSKIAAVGSYEAHVTDMAKGECDYLMDIYASMLTSLSTTEDSSLYKYGYCDHCEKDVVWQPFGEKYDPASELAAGHYVLIGDMDGGKKTLAAGATVCFDLNGNKLTSTNRVFDVNAGQILNIYDSVGTGSMAGSGGATTGGKLYGGSLYVGDGGVCNLYSGTVTFQAVDGKAAARGGCVAVGDGGEFNIHGGTITGGQVKWPSSDNWGGNVYVEGGVCNMYGGEISGGKAHSLIGYQGNGGNVALAPSANGNATFNMFGGTISGGQVVIDDANNPAGYGGNVYIYNYSTLKLAGGAISGGSAHTQGNSVYAVTNANITLTGSGSANELYYNNTARLTVSGTYTGFVTLRNDSLSVSKGTQVGRASNAALDGGTLAIYGTDFIAQVSGTKLVAGDGQNCPTCGAVVPVSNLTQALFDGYNGNLPAGHYKLTENITYTGTDAILENAVCLNMAGYNLTVNGYTVNDNASLFVGGVGEVKHSTDKTPAVIVKQGGKLTLTGGVNIRAKYESASADSFIIKGTYSGYAYLTPAAGGTELTDIGNVNGNITVGVFLQGTAYSARVLGDDLVMWTAANKILRNSTAYTDVAQAISDYKSGDTLVLMSDVGANTTVNKSLKVDLNGFEFNPTVNSGTLTLLDSTTADYDVVDGEYTKVSAALNTVAADGYIKCSHDDGTVSFHKVDAVVSSVSVRPVKAGIYYGSTFKGDQVVKENVQSFGVALSAVGDPKAANGTIATHSQFSTFENGDFEPGNTEEYASTVLVDILTGNYSVYKNAKNGNTKVYGRPYILLTDGSYIWGDTAKMNGQEGISLLDTLKYISANWDAMKLNATQQKGIFDLYEKYNLVFNKWTSEYGADLSGIKTAYEQAEQEQVSVEDKKLKVLTLGHSLAVDSGHMLNMITDVEGIKGGYDEVVIATLYYGGCKLSEHVSFMNNDSPNYILYYSTTATPDKKPVLTENVTMKWGLEYDYWDIIIMQGGVFEQLDTTLVKNGNIEKIQKYVNAYKENPEATFAWHMPWASPTDQDLRDTYMNISGVTSNWYTNKYEQYGFTTRTDMYNAIVNCNSANIEGKYNFQFVIPTGTAIENALSSSAMTEKTLYRDYTHLSDIGRVIASYTWYCRLMGIEKLDSIKLSSIPVEFFRTTGGTSPRTLTTAEKNIILEAVNNALKTPYAMTQSVY